MKGFSKPVRRVATPDEIVEYGRDGLEQKGLLPPIAGASPIMSEVVFGFAKETAFGTFVAPTRFMPGIPTITSTRNIVRPEQARGYRGYSFDQVVGMTTDVAITGELIPDGSFNFACANAFGSGGDNYSSAGGVATHSLTPQPQLAPISFEQDTDIIPGEQVLTRQVAGCYVDQFQLKMTNQQLITSTINLVGQREVTPTTPGAPSVPNPTYFANASPFGFSMLATTYKGVNSTQMLDCTLALMNHVQRVFAANGQFYAARLVPTRREVTLTTLLDFLDTNFFLDWFNGTKTTGWVFTLTHVQNIPTTATPYSITITVPGTRASGEYSMPVATDVIQQNVSWSVTLAGSNEISSVWQDDTAGQLS